jgi:hypothetical protein
MKTAVMVTGVMPAAVTGGRRARAARVQKCDNWVDCVARERKGAKDGGWIQGCCYVLVWDEAAGQLVIQLLKQDCFSAVNAF